MNQTPQKTQQEQDAEMLRQYHSNPVYVMQNNEQPSAPTIENSDAITLLVMGIVAVAVFEIVPLASIILGIIGMKKAKEYAEQGLELSGKAKIGAMLAKIGFWIGIAASALYVIGITLTLGGALIQIFFEAVVNSIFRNF